MDKTNEGINEEVKNMQRRGQNEHLKHGERTKTNLYSTTIKLTLIHKKYC